MRLRDRYREMDSTGGRKKREREKDGKRDKDEREREEKSDSKRKLEAEGTVMKITARLYAGSRRCSFLLTNQTAVVD